MASSRLLHFVFSPRAAVEVASFKKWPLQRSIHAVAAASSPKEIQHLRFKIEGVISEVGGKMVVADMRFTRDAFDYWKNAAIPSDSIVKDLASTWANMDSISSTPSLPFKFYADRTVGKKMEDFLQRMVANIEQRFTREGFNHLKGRRLVVRLADEQELMVANEGNSEFEHVFDRGLDVKHGCSRSKDVPSADEQGPMVKEGKPVAEQSFDRRLELQELRANEEKVEPEQGFDGRLVVQLSDKQEVMAKVESSVRKQERSDLQEFSGKEEDEQKAMEKGKNLEATHRTEKKEGTEMQKREAEKQIHEGEKDYSQQQTDNIVLRTRRMGRKIVHIYYDKSNSGRVSLYR